MLVVKSDAFFQKAIQSLARALAHLNPTPEDKVNEDFKKKNLICIKLICPSNFSSYILQIQQLFKFCPQESSAGVFCIDTRAHESVVALGLYFLESEYQYENLIIPYLLRLLKGLPKSIHKEDEAKLIEKKTDSKFNIVP